MKYTGNELQTLQDKDKISLRENIIRGGICSVMGNRYVESYENKKIIYMDSTILYGYSMSQSLPYDEIKFDKNVKLEENLNTPDDSDIGYFIEVELGYPDYLREKNKKNSILS